MKYNVVIVGGGLGGLQCAFILAKKGMNVCVVEKERKLGGCLQMFSRKRMDFDTGFHYVGDLGDGEPLNRIFNYFNLMSLPWVKLDEDAFDEVRFGNDKYFFANGFDNFAGRLAEQFPHQKAALLKYASLLKDVNRNIENSLKGRNPDEVYTQSLFAKSAYDFLNETFDDKRLLQVLSGTSLKMELNPATLPLYIFAQINSSFIQSAWRLRGGGDVIVDRLADNLKSMGVTLITNTAVNSLVEKDDKIIAARLSDGETVEADCFISDIHPAATMELLKESKCVRKVFRNRIKNIPNTTGMFTVNCRLKPGTFKYLNRNIYLYDTDDVWSLCNRAAGDDVKGVLVSFQPPMSGYDAVGVDILTPMNYSEVEPFADSIPMHRTDGYEALKRKFTVQSLALAERALPGLSDAIDASYTSSPLTYQYYTATHQGSAYGIRKDYNNLMFTLLTPRTPAKNLFLTGQNLNLHGLLGVSMTSFITCSEIVGPVSPFNEF